MVGPPISRRIKEISNYREVFGELKGVLVNNSDSVNNQCHTRHWRVEKVEEESQVESQEESTSEA